MPTQNKILSIRPSFQPPAPEAAWEIQASSFIDKLPKLQESDTRRLILIGAILNLCEASHYQRRYPHNKAIRHKSLDIAKGVAWTFEAYASHLPHSGSWLRVELERVVRKAVNQTRYHLLRINSP